MATKKKIDWEALKKPKNRTKREEVNIWQRVKDLRVPENDRYKGGADDLSPFIPTFRNVPFKRTGTHDRTVSLKDLSPDQKEAYDAVLDMAQTNSYIKLGGLAGTGKSTLIPLVAKALGNLENTGFCTLTGKAANVLERKLYAAGVHEYAHCGTIHSMMYKPVTDDHGRIIRWVRNQTLQTWGGIKINKILMDEASMVGQDILDDLQSYGIPIIAVGDPGQLPPVKDKPVFVDPDFTLTKIHRQAESNPIIQLAHEIRNTGRIPKNWPNSEHVRFINQIDSGDVIADGFSRLGLNFGILVRTNNLRKKLNMDFRSQPEPEVGDIVICLRNNPPLFNGMRGILKSVETFSSHWFVCTVEFPDDGMEVSGAFNKHQFGAEYTIGSKHEIGLGPTDEMGLLFDYGSAMTVHKAQGSGFEEAIFSPLRFSSDTDEDYSKWCYTAVTRAANKLTIINL